MKNSTIICVLLVCSMAFSQTKKNGTIYIEHPAIKVAEQMQQAFIKGDTTVLKNLLADDFKSYNGMNSNPEYKGSDKSSFLKQSAFWNNNASYLTIERSNGAYPDALHYKKDNDDGKVWVQTWDQLKGVHDKTGVKLNMPLHRLFVVNKDNKIEKVISYDDGTVFDELRAGFNERTNGTIYNQHEYINKVRRMMAAFEHLDLEKAFSYFDENARYSNLEMPIGESLSVDEVKAMHQEFYKNFEIQSIDVVGYPDALEYEIGGGVTVQSWWNFRLNRKSDNKKLVMPAMYIHDFNDEGNIVRTLAYFSTKPLEIK